MAVADDATRADMWFRRAGELLDEVSKERERSAAATGEAAMAKAMAARAESRADELRARCEELERNLDEERRARAKSGTALARDVNDAEERMLLLDDECKRLKGLLEEERSEKQQRSRALEEQLADEKAKRAALQKQIEALSNALESSERHAHELREAGSVGSSGEGGDDEEKEKGYPSPSTPTGALVCVERAPPADGDAARSALETMARDVLGGELERLVSELRDGAVEQAEEACNARVALLEKAVGELLTAMDGKTHHLLLKWRGQLEATKRESEVLKDQLRTQHVRGVDLRNHIKRLESERTETAQRLAKHEAREQARQRQHYGATTAGRATTRRTAPRARAAPSAAPAPAPQLSATACAAGGGAVTAGAPPPGAFPQQMYGPVGIVPLQTVMAPVSWPSYASFIKPGV